MKILWVRAAIAGVLAEVVLIAILVGIFRPLYAGRADLAVVLSGGFALMLVAGWWVGHKARSRFILHGALVGVAAVALYTALTLRLTLNGQLKLDVWFFTAHALKILGGAVGGFLAGRVKS